MPPPPPFFGPGDLFSHKEMEEGFTDMKKNFEQIQALREEFAARLKKQSVTKEEVLKHFSDVDKLMSNGRNQMQDKAAAKISTMTPQERQKFADRLLGN
jgi:flagellar motility protein MotE (MotC chaperone)